MTIVNPLAGISTNVLPATVMALARQHLMQQQGALVNQQAGLVGQQQQQAAVATKLAQARLPLVLSALHSFEQPANDQGVTPGGMQMMSNATGPAAPTVQPDGSGAGPPGAPPGAGIPGAAPGAGIPGGAQGRNGQQAQADQGIATARAIMGGLPGGQDLTTGSPGSAATTDSLLRQQFYVNPAGTPQEVRNLVVAGLSGDPGLLAAAKYQRDLGVENRLAESRFAASNLYDGLTSVVDAGRGQALATLAAVAPGAAKQIERTAANPAQADTMARQFASSVAGEVHQYTGRKVMINKAGEYRDTLTGQPVPGVEKMGLSNEQWTDLAVKGMQPVAVPQSNGTTVTVPRWQAPGSHANSLEQWMTDMARRGGVPGVQPTISGAPRVAAHFAIQNGIRQAHAQATQANGGIPPPIANTDPQLVKALSDKSYRLQNPAPTYGVSATPEMIEQQKLVAQSRAQLMQSSQAATQTAAQSITYLRAAQMIMETKGKAPLTGFGGEIVNQVTRLFNGANSTNYQQVAKYLNNAAVQTARQQYGSRMTQSEVQLQLHEMSPNVAQTPQAMDALIGENVRNAQYAVASAARVRSYLLAGNDPQSFAEWNQQYFPQSQIVNRTGAAGAVPPVRVASVAQVEKLPKGTPYMTPDGRVFVRN